MSPGVTNPACSGGFEFRFRRQQHSLFPWNSCVLQKRKKCTGSGGLEQRYLTSLRLRFVWKKKKLKLSFIYQRMINIQKQVCQPEPCLMACFLPWEQPGYWGFWRSGEEPLSLICVWIFLCSMPPTPGAVCKCSGRFYLSSAPWAVRCSRSSQKMLTNTGCLLWE